MFIKPPDRTSLLIFAEANRPKGSITPRQASSRAPGSTDSGSALSMQVRCWPVTYWINLGLLWVQQLISCFKGKVVLIKYMRLTSERVCWGSPLFTAQKQPAWTTLAILRREAPPDSPLPSLAAGSATRAQARLKQRHPLKHELAPKSTRGAKLLSMRSRILQDAVNVNMHF